MYKIWNWGWRKRDSGAQKSSTVDPVGKIRKKARGRGREKRRSKRGKRERGSGNTERWTSNPTDEDFFFNKKKKGSMSDKILQNEKKEDSG